GFSLYSSGVKHHGKSARIIISDTFPSALATICQLSTTALWNGSVFAQGLCSDNEITLVGCLAANHMHTAAPSDRPEMCALDRPTDCIKAATSSASTSVE